MKTLAVGELKARCRIHADFDMTDAEALSS